MRPYCVGLSGGAGAGKSTVSAIFAGYGITVVDTDAISRKLTSAGGAAMPAIAAAFGHEFIDGAGGLSRPAMRSLVFSDAAARHRLEMILHPLIKADAVQQVLAATSPYVVLVVPLLAEKLADYRALVDRILMVDCDEAQQLSRIAARPTMNLEAAKALLAAQHGRNSRLAIADDIIDNRGNLVDLAEKVSALHARYLAAAREKSTTAANNALQ